jgi:hypothetical protein
MIMKKIDRLKREASDAATWRGHKMGRFTHFTHTAISECSICGASVEVDTRPPANGIDIGGPAVAIGCGGNNE